MRKERSKTGKEKVENVVKREERVREKQSRKNKMGHRRTVRGKL